MIVPPSKKSCRVETRWKDKPFVFQRRLCASWKLLLIQYLRVDVLPLACIRPDLFVRRSLSPPSPSLFSSPLRCYGGSGGGETFVELIGLVEMWCWWMCP